MGGIYDIERLKCLRAHAACYLHGHSVGGTNPSLLEALACGNVVVAHDNPFNREVARDAACFFSTEEQLAAALGQVRALTPGERQARVVRARNIVAKNYTWELITDQYDTLMNTELAGAASGVGRG